MYTRSRLAATVVALLVTAGCAATEDTAPDASINPLAGEASTTTSEATTSTTAETTTTKAPTTTEPTTAAPETEPPTTAPPETAPPTTPPPTTAAAAHYENCDAVRAAGAAPLHKGDPGYSSKLDRDGDGVACE